MRMHESRTHLVHERQRDAQQRVLGRLCPGEQRLGAEVDRDRIDGSAMHVDAVDRLGHGLVLLAAGDHVDLVAAGGKRSRQPFDMSAEAAHHERRVLPRHHENTHGGRH
jgi:hypothetical protein